MTLILKHSQFATAISATFTQAPTIIGTPFLPQTTAGSPVVFTGVTGSTGVPTPTIQYDLYKNGVLLIPNYVSTSYQGEIVGDTLVIVATANNGIGAPAVVSSATMVVSAPIPIGGPVWTNQSPMAATAGTDYSYPFSASNSPTYSVATGSLPSGLSLSITGKLTGRATTPGTYNFTIAATNGVSVTNSNPLSITVSYMARVRQAPFVGVPVSYEIPNFPGTITSQQWYKNTGGGPVAISGATSATYTPVTGDIGAHLSIRTVTSLGNINSMEFSSSGTIISQTSGVLQSADATSYLGQQPSGITVYTVCNVRIVLGAYYVESVLAPGTYMGSQLGTLSSAPGYTNDFAINVVMWSSTTMPAVAAVASKGASTATRPSANTGIGHFVTNGALYDGNGHKWLIRGTNWTHYDNAATGITNTGASGIRLEMYLTQTWTVNKPLIDRLIAAHCVPILAHFANSGTGMTATVSGTTLTLVTRTQGYLYVGIIVSMAGLPGGKATIIDIGTTNGGLGAYTISGVGATITTPQTVSIFDYTTSNPSIQCVQTAARNWVDVVSNVSTYDSQSIINIANEWGPTASASNTVWRDTYGYKDTGGVVHPGVVQTMRSAGYQGCLMIDAGGNGQDVYCLINHAASVLAADPLQNIVFSLHIYGSHKPGRLLGNLDAIKATGISCILGEFGPGTPTAPDSNCCIDPLDVVAEAESRDMGWMTWSWDNHRQTVPPELDGYYTLVYDWYQGYQTSNSADLTIFGKKVTLDPIYGSLYSTKATTV